MMHKVYRHTETEEFYVNVRGGYMEDCDFYGEGGYAWSEAELIEDGGSLDYVGDFTNVQIENCEHAMTNA